MKTYFSRFGTFLNPTTRLVAGIFLVAIAAHATLATISFGADARRERQLKIDRLDENLNRVRASLGGAALGESTVDIDFALSDLDQSVKEFYGDSSAREDRTIIAECAQYRAIAVQEEASDKRGDFDGARKLEVETADPIFARLELKLSQALITAGADARRWLLAVQILEGATLYGSALLISIFVLRFRRQLVKSTVEEASRLAIETSARRLGTLVHNSADVIALSTASGEVTFVSGACERTWGITARALVEQSYQQIVISDDRTRLISCVQESLQTPRGEAQVELHVLDATGSLHDCQVRVSNLLDDPDVNSLLLTFHDITERREFEAELSHQAFHDSLTQLPNRALMMDRLSQRLQRSADSRRSVAVLFLDLDNFKIINDSLGHDAGDQLLIQVAERILGSVRPGDTVARLAGDEFTMFLESPIAESEAIQVATRLIEQLKNPFTVMGRELFVTASIGIAVGTDDSDAEGMIRDADTAMYQVKGHGKSAFLVFDPSMQTSVVERLELQSSLRTALERNEFMLYFQPIVDLKSEQVLDVEALIRWNHPTLGIVPPLKFIPLLEETGLICEVGAWVLDEACAQIRRWESEHTGKPIRMSVNVSGRQLVQDDYVERVATTLKRHGLPASQLKLEVTESVMLVDIDASRRVFEALRALGVKIAIDDFGTGYSSMSYLTQLPVDTLKIDRSFINMIASDTHATGIVRAIIAMAKTLGMSVTSEGIETADQLQTLQQLGCDKGQGYLFAKPMTAEAFGEMLKHQEDKVLTRAA